MPIELGAQPPHDSARTGTPHTSTSIRSRSIDASSVAPCLCDTFRPPPVPSSALMGAPQARLIDETDGGEQAPPLWGPVDCPVKHRNVKGRGPFWGACAPRTRASGEQLHPMGLLTHSRCAGGGGRRGAQHAWRLCWPLLVTLLASRLSACAVSAFPTGAPTCMATGTCEGIRWSSMSTEHGTDSPRPHPFCLGRRARQPHPWRRQPSAGAAVLL